MGVKGSHQGAGLLSCTPAELVTTVLAEDRRVLLFGAPGMGKSTLAAGLARELDRSGRSCWAISADPGSPAFGPPGCVSLGHWRENRWQLVAHEALCTLDAGRFRLPLVQAVAALRPLAGDGVLLLDSPGVVRGTAGKELLQGLMGAAAIQAILALSAPDRAMPLGDELAASGVAVLPLRADTAARCPSKQARAERRTRQWDEHLASAEERLFDAASLPLLGTPPPVESAASWLGCQVALLQGGRTRAVGEVKHMEDGRLSVRLAPAATGDAMLIRNAQRNAEGLLATAEPYVKEPLEYLRAPDSLPAVAQDGGPRVVGRVGTVDVCLVNGVFGDPLLHLRLRHERRSLLFDLGDGSRLPARIAHQVSDVFISHAHLDHISGFVWLMRSRIGEFPPCRVYGPPGLAANIAGFMQAILWDRVKERGPVFVVTEIHGDRWRRYRYQAGGLAGEFLGEGELVNGIVLDEPAFRVRATTLDHGTPVMAYAYEPVKQYHVRKDRLAQTGLAAGPWLGRLKTALAREEGGCSIPLPDGREVAAAELAKELILVAPAKKLVYATDFADHGENRRRLRELAFLAHTFFCEATFLQAEAEQARRTGHLTTRTCAELACEAKVARLVPFHFSRRYQHAPEQIYDEISALCAAVVAPQSYRPFRPAQREAVESITELD